jgi:excisionase family DNA binding protein
MIRSAEMPAFNFLTGGIMRKETFVTAKDAARQLGVSQSTIYRWFWEGKLQGKKLSDKTIHIFSGSVEKVMATAW